MIKGIIILANGFEDTEALATIDVLKRSKIAIDIVTINETLEVESQTNLIVKANYLLKDVDLNSYDFLIIPGGRAVAAVLDKEKQIDEVIKYFVEKDKLVATICAAPSLVGKLGYFSDISYTCFPTYEKNVVKGEYQQDKTVIRNGNFITAKAMAYSLDFALEIIEFFQGAEKRERVYKSICGEL